VRRCCAEGGDTAAKCHQSTNFQTAHVLKREEGAGSWRRLHNEELHNLYASPNIISVIK
jgi:hypothetical protein